MTTLDVNVFILCFASLLFCLPGTVWLLFRAVAVAIIVGAVAAIPALIIHALVAVFS